MSRLIIKGLPSRYDDKHLRELFEPAGQVTDAKVIKTPDGRSRQFGFVGFRTPQEAKNARHRLNKSYVDTAKVSVDFAHAVGAEAIPRPWSKYSKGSSLHEKRTTSAEETTRKEFLKAEAERIKKLKQKKQRDGKDATEKSNSLLDDFRDSASKRSSKPIWADGALQPKVKSTLVASRKTGGEGKMLERKHVTFNADDSEDEQGSAEEEEDELYEDIPAKNSVEKDKNVVGEDEQGGRVALDAGVSDLDYLKSKMVSVGGGNVDPHMDEANANDGNKGDDKSTEDSDSNEDDVEEGQEVKVSVEKEVEIDDSKASPPAEDAAVTKAKGDVNLPDAGETGRLMVRNLAFAVNEEELETAFEQFGTLADVHIVKDSKTGKSRGMAFIQYVVPENAPRALVEMDGSFLCGRILHVLPGRPRPMANNWSTGDAKRNSKPGMSSFKEEKEESQKDAARKGLDATAQHAMHVSSDAVAQLVSNQHGVSKSDLFGTSRGESGTAAVRLAIGEASVQAEIREFFAENGIDLSAAEKANVELIAKTAAARRKRESRTAFLVKNLPARTSEGELRDKFSSFGTLKRAVVAPSGLLAVIEFKLASDAKRAYNGLAYTKFRDTPLYLQWLPTEAIKDVVRPTSQEAAETKSDPPQTSNVEAELDVEEAQASNEVQQGSVYVKNLNFDTRDSGLRSHFCKALRKRPELVRSLRSAKVAMKRGREGKESQMLSMGFGFLEFSSREDAMAAIKIAQNSVLDGHTLQLRLSSRGEENQSSSRNKKRTRGKSQKPGLKLMVRNIAFEATKRDITQLFSSFGQLKTVRIPKKPDGSHRGFAFVEFASKTEAKAAFESLASAHLYGRHLVIEYADEEEGAVSVEALQEKAAAHVAKKRIRANDGTALATLENDSNEKNDDEHALLQDELYS